ncbi:MAG: hypothetical protein KUG83_04850 [Gammaproteobacteria bacterium]|nr:hypothetical protein [Gammaproteobacteria bacterium]
MPKAKRIQPFFHSLTPKMRILIYLLSSEQFSFDSLRKLTVAEFSELPLLNSLPPALELEDIVSELKKRPKDSMVFSRDSGRNYSILDISNILKRAHKVAGHEYSGLDAFVEHIAS